MVISETPSILESYDLSENENRRDAKSKHHKEQSGSRENEDGVLYCGKGWVEGERLKLKKINFTDLTVLCGYGWHWRDT